MSRRRPVDGPWPAPTQQSKRGGHRQRPRPGVEYCDIERTIAEGLDEFLESLQVEIYQVAEAAREPTSSSSGTDLRLHAYRSA